MRRQAEFVSAAVLFVLCAAWCSGAARQGRGPSASAPATSRPATARSPQAPRPPAGQEAGTPAAPGVVVLDTNGFWRMHQTLQPPVARVEGALKPLLLKAAWVDRATPGPEADWRKPDFDDHRWLRGPARLVVASPYLSRLCLRGKFNVTDPAKVEGLRLSLAYHGGVVVTVNGQEVARGHVAPGEADLAEDYPAEAFLTPEGKLLTFEPARRTVREGDPRLKMIRRSIDEVEVPAKVLRPGPNVVAVEVLRAPYPGVVDEKRDPKQNYWSFAWDNCQVERVQLTAAGEGGLQPNASRPAGFQVWNSNLLAADYDLDFGDATEKVQPVEIVAARNGEFSGKVVAGSSRAIRGLKAVAADLKGEGGKIAASAVRIRYGLPWGKDEINAPYGVYPYPAEATLLGALCDDPPEEVPLGKAKPAARKPGEVEPASGAVVPIWVTVTVPKDARPGAYKGEFTVQAAGEKPVAVPLAVKVVDWALPDAQDRRTNVEVLQSPDTLSKEYDAPLWSPRHWELIAESFRLLSNSGSRLVYVPLIAETNFGHEQSMVRWVRKPLDRLATGGENSYDYDFDVMEKYLDAAERNLGKPKAVVCWVWDVYMLDKNRGTPGSLDARWQAEREAGGKGLVYGQGPVVTTWDAAAGKADRMMLPRYTEANSEALWRPLVEQLRRRLAQRGLDKALMLGMMTDVWPTKDEVAFWAKVAPDAPWVIHSHGGGGPLVYQLAKVGYQIRVWGIQNATDKSLMGWKRPEVLNRYWRQWGFNAYPTAAWRQLCEFAITGNQNGTGRLGGDFWEVFRDKNGQRKDRIYSRYPQSNWRNLDIYVSLLAPGPAGPAATQHYVNLVEGVQECEARIVLERALSDPALRARLGEDLASRCEAALEERLRCMELCFCTLTNRLESNPAGIGSTGGPGTAGHFWCIASGWERREEKIFTLAGEVERALGSP